MSEPVPTYSIIMVVHNTLQMARMSIQQTLRHTADNSARLVVVDNNSAEKTRIMLEMFAARGDIDLIRTEQNTGHGPGIELARDRIKSPIIVTLDSDAFPLADNWMDVMHARLNDRVKIVGIKHHRDYIHPSCLMIARNTLEEIDVTFLNEKHLPSRLDVAERISLELKQRGYQIAGLERTRALRRGSISEPVYLGAVYEDMVYHQWYTTRTELSKRGRVDDVPVKALKKSLSDVFAGYHGEKRDVAVVIGIRGSPGEPERLQNALACLNVINKQMLERWRYSVVLVEQDSEPRLEQALTPLVDRYVFAFNPGPYNRGWAFNIGAKMLENQADVLCLLDADLLVPSDFLSRCSQMIHNGSEAVLPYSEILYLDTASTKSALQNLDDLQQNENRFKGRVYTTSRGGCLWITPQLYLKIGGHDERLRGWGYEDREFYGRLSQTVTVERLPGRLLHLKHRRPRVEERSAALNREIAAQHAPAGSIGDPNLYSIEKKTPHSEKTSHIPGQREWEHWNKWSESRIKRIVRREKQIEPGQSNRFLLAQLIVQLGDSLLDLGCGPGALWPHFEQYLHRFQWAGADVTKKMVATARQLFPQVPVYHVDAGDTGLENKSFDVVLLRHVLEHLPQKNMEAAVTEAIRLARKAVVIDFYVPPLMEGQRESHIVGEGFIETRWTREEIERPITRTGWGVGERVTLSGRSNEVDEVWVLRPARQQQNDSRPEGTAVKKEVLKFSIIMPTYKRTHAIYRTVDSILAQTYQHWELIIVNNNRWPSNHVFFDPRIHEYHHGKRASSSYARNQGLQYATGDLVCFFDDDDEMYPHYLESIVAAFIKNPQANMVRCGMHVSGGRVNYSLATPECCLRRDYATATWDNNGPAQDQRYFRTIVAQNEWSEEAGDIVMIRESLCRANANSKGGLRAGQY